MHIRRRHTTYVLAIIAATFAVASGSILIVTAAAGSDPLFGLTSPATFFAGGYAVHDKQRNIPSPPFDDLAFTNGNLAVLRTDESDNNSPASVVELNTTMAGQTPGNIIAIPGTGVDAMRFSASATSTGYVGRTNDNSLLTFVGANSTDTTANVNTLNPRAVGTVNSAGNFAKQTTYTGTSGNQTRGASSLNNSAWFIGDQGGIYTNGATSASPSGNFRAVKSFGGIVYANQASGTATTIQVVTISAPTGGTATGLPGLTNNANIQDFYLISSGDNGSAFDVLYIVSATSNTAGTITKFSLVGGTWAANGSYTTTFGGFGLAASDSGNGASLYVSTGQGALVANSVLKLADTAGYNAAINITTANNITLYTAGAGTVVKGLDFTPITVADDAPSVTSTSPANSATNVPTNATVTINFSEPVNLTASAVTLSCGAAQTFTGLPASNVTSVTLTPSTNLPASTLCTATVVAAQVTDVDTNDPPDNLAADFIFTFTTAAGANSNPKINENTATNYINLPASAPAANSAFLSGVISDPTDPGATLGADFTISDSETGVNLLTVAAVSSNAAVVPSDAAHLILTGSGANRNLKIVPTGVGYSNITVTVTDGGGLTGVYVISYAASAASTHPATTFFHTGTSDGSAVAVVDASFMFVGDDENQALRLYSRSNSGLPFYSLDVSASLDFSADPGRPEADIEAAAKVGSRIYWITSHGNSSGGGIRPNRNRIFATDIIGTGAAATLTYVGRFDNLRTDLINWDVNNGHGLGANYYGFAASAASGIPPENPGGNGFSIEGLVMAPGSTTTGYVSFRAPISPALARTKGLIVPVTNLNLLVTGNPTAGNATFGAPIELDLGGRGIRDIARNASNEYVIVAGPATGSGTFALYTWTGNPADPAVQRNADLTGLRPEGIAEIPAGPLTAASVIQLITDDGDTVFYNDGIIAKELAQSNFKKFHSDFDGPGLRTDANANEYSNGDADDYSDGDTDDYPDGHANEHSDSDTDGNAHQYANSDADEHANRNADEYTDEHSDGNTY